MKLANRYCALTLVILVLYVVTTMLEPWTPYGNGKKLVRKKRYLKPVTKMVYLSPLERTKATELFITESIEDIQKNHTRVTNFAEPYPRYIHPNDLDLQARLSFPLGPEVMRKHKLDKVSTLARIPAPSVINKNLVFVTAACGSYYAAARQAIILVQHFYPNNSIIYYDLGSGKEAHSIKEFCNVEYRTFNYTNYPPHVKKRKNYAWKFLIIKEVLESHDVIFWMDSSIVFHNSDLYKVLNRNYTSPIYLATYTGHNTYGVTFKQLYDYLPTNQSKQMDMMQFEANNILIIKTQRAHLGILQWIYYCSLVAKCIDPHGATVSCGSNRGRKRDAHRNCHRYDQSTLNLLLSNYFNYDLDMYRHGEHFFDYRPYSVSRGGRKKNKRPVYYTCDTQGKRTEHNNK